MGQGSRVKISGIVLAEKSENGWKYISNQGHAVSEVAGGGHTASEATGGAPVATPAERQLTPQEAVAKAKQELSIIEGAIDRYLADNGSYPKGKMGLGFLIQGPFGSSTWKGPYLKTLDKDPWGQAYIFEYPGVHNTTSYGQNAKSYDLMSMGPDGRVGGGDDITNW